MTPDSPLRPPLDDATIRAAERERRLLKWSAVLLPAFAVYLYETVRHDLLEHTLPVGYGNLLVALITLVCSFLFATLVFRRMDDLQRQAIRREREISALTGSLRERERLSRELHDGLAQLVAALLVRIDTLVGLVSGNQRHQAVTELERLRQEADDLYVDVRESIGALRTELRENQLPAALRDCLDAFEERHGILSFLDVQGDVSLIPPTAAYEMLRIAQEALSNVRKHAQADGVYVSLRATPDDGIELAIRDDGVGCVIDTLRQRGSRGIGLQSMRERAESVGASLELLSQPSGGTTVRVQLPLITSLIDSEGRHATTAAR